MSSTTEDKALTEARELLAADEDELRARIVATAIRARQSSREHAERMQQLAAIPPNVLNLARLIAKYDLTEQVTDVVEHHIRVLQANLEPETTDAN